MPEPRVRLLIIYPSGSRAVISGRFFSLHKNYQRRRSRFKFMKPENGVLVDETYQGPATCLLQHVASWNFNTFTLDHLTNGRALFHLGVHLFEEYGLIQHFRLDHLKLMKCFGMIEASYHGTNPFHNSIHAADVTQALHCVMQQQQIQRHLSKLEIMSALFAAAGHDVDHPGVNQPFLVSTRNYLAALYHNKSVLENHHWRTSICLIRQSGVLDSLTPQELVQFEGTMKTMILATDITRQPELIASFKTLNDKKTLEEIMVDAEDRQFVLQIILKCADINNPCRPWAISRVWSQRCVHEFFKQGDRERRLNLPVTAICDRKTNNLPRIQVGFIEYVVRPLFTEWERFVANALTTNMLKNLKLNLAKWENLAEEYAAKHAEFAQLTSAKPEPPAKVIGRRVLEDIKAWTSELPAVTLPLYHSHRRSIIAGTKRRHSLPPVLSSDKRPRTSFHREQMSDPRSRRHSVFSETLVRFSTSGDPFVDKVSFAEEPHFQQVLYPAPSWSTEDIAPRMSRITSLTCDTEVSRISTAVTADTDSEVDEIGPVFAREDSVDLEEPLTVIMKTSFDDDEHLLTEDGDELCEEDPEVEEEDKENGEEDVLGETRESLLYYDYNARGPRYFEKNIKEEEETEMKSPLPDRRHSRLPHPSSDPLLKRRSIPPFLSLCDPGGGMTGERLVMRRRSDPVTPPFGLANLAAASSQDDEEEAEPPPSRLFQRRRGSEPVAVLSATQRILFQGLHHSSSASSMIEELRRSASLLEEHLERRQPNHHASPGTTSRSGTPLLHRVSSSEDNG
ncbi:hypothetical protein RvY_10671-2 [Ramazzottius varieornatus]|uniref:Phosphodiesterase n=1 Tax=Ramazzottius varieornatus TaxID=947166 RepID=A0A1D1VLC5_RAMVA|nr:hypothetical protein RvY_10671-2 [Ramazzottius varieornatus]